MEGEFWVLDDHQKRNSGHFLKSKNSTTTITKTVVYLYDKYLTSLDNQRPDNPPLVSIFGGGMKENEIMDFKTSSMHHEHYLL